MAHSRKASPSALSRMARCPGSAVMAAEYKHLEGDAVDAKRGSLVHALAETFARADNGITPIDMVGDTIKIDGQDLEVTPADAEAAEAYLDEIRPLIQGRGDYLLESLVFYGDALRDSGLPGDLVDQCWGTLDFAHFDDQSGRLTIKDLKSGIRIVQPDDPQLLAYMLGAANYFGLIYDEPDSVELTVCMPRLGRNFTVVYPWAEAREKAVSTIASILRGSVTATERVAELIGRVAPKVIAATLADCKALSASVDACRYCPALVACPAVNQAIKAEVDWERIHAGTPAPEDPDALSRAYDRTPLIELYLARVAETVRGRLAQGEPVPGYKLVQGKPGRVKWSDAAAAEETVKRMRIKVGDAYTKKLRTPTQIMKLVKDDERKVEALKALTERPEGRPIVVPDVDPRPELSGSGVTASDFDD